MLVSMDLAVEKQKLLNITVNSIGSSHVR